MEMLPPNEKHGAVMWLLSVLVDQRQDRLEPDGIVGVLPGHYGFDEVTAALGRIPGNFFTGEDRGRREIRFAPQDAFVYASLADMLRRRSSAMSKVPDRFTLRDLDYEHGVTQNIPLRVRWYFQAVDLWNGLSTIASYRSGGDTLHFIVAHNKEVSVSLNYTSDELEHLPSLQMFTGEVVNSDLHKQEKWTICRSGMVEQFGAKRSVTFGKLIGGFESLMIYFRESYALFLADFSTAKVRREVEKQNLDDALRLNKTLAEIQNQLLALPAATLVVGATVDPTSVPKNVAVLVGVAIFVVMMWLLIGNQKNSVEAIGREVALRRDLLNAQPKDVSDQYADAFKVLESRARAQLRVLALIRGLVLLVFLLTVYLAVDAISAGSISSFWSNLAVGNCCAK